MLKDRGMQHCFDCVVVGQPRGIGVAVFHTALHGSECEHLCIGECMDGGTVELCQLKQCKSSPECEKIYVLF